MKLSFSIPGKSKSSSKPKLSSSIESEPQSNDTNTRQFVTEFDPSKTLISKPKLIIPPKDNEWRPHKKLKNLHTLPSLQSSDPGGLSFEVAADVDDGDKMMSYGLNVRNSGDGEEGGDKIAPAMPRFENSENILLEKLRYDLQRLPEDRGFDEFKDVPVEGFGAALLAGYGWSEGRGIGRNAKEDVKVKQYKRRTDKEGLGFVASSVNGNKANRNGESVRDNDGNDSDRYRDGGNERKRERDGFCVGKDVRVVAGGRGVYGLKGVILERLNDDWVVLKVGESEEERKVSVSDIAELGSKEEEKCLRKLKALQLENGKKTKDKERRDNVRKDTGPAKDEKKQWLRNHIRVRVISKDLIGGRFYLKKGEVVDVVGPYVCDISMDGTGELVQGVDQDVLETALPRRGGPVLVLYGKHKGAFGNLVEKDLDRETAVVQDSDTREFFNVKLEQIAEYVGDPSHIGY